MLPPKKTDVGFASRAMIEKLIKNKKVSELHLLSYYVECQAFLKPMVKKILEILEKCPLKYSIVRCLVALDPRFMVHQPETAAFKGCWHCCYHTEDTLQINVIKPSTSLMSCSKNWRPTTKMNAVPLTLLARG